MDTKNQFIKALEENDLQGIKRVPKSDLHCHSGLNGRYEDVSKRLPRPIPRPAEYFDTFADFEKYIFGDIYLNDRSNLDILISEAFRQPKSDGVTRLEMSFDFNFVYFFDSKIEKLIEYIDEMHQKEAPGILSKPEIGFSRTFTAKEIEPIMIPLIESGWVGSIDLYGDELAHPAKEYQYIYKTADRYNVKRKAHVGEYGTAEDVREVVELFNLNAVQHGIAAAESAEVMDFLAKNNIPLNVCPSSNVSLKRVKSIQTHPARVLYDQGINITINSDDILIFGKSVSEEYALLYNEKVFTAEELNVIRENGLNQ